MSLPPLQDLLDLFPDNTSGEIEPVDLRDQTTALYNAIEDNENNFFNYLPTSGLIPLDAGYSPTQPQNIATKAYVDFASGGGIFVAKTGDTMSGPLKLPFADPTTYTEAAHKGYVDSKFDDLANDVDTNYLRLSGGTMTGTLNLAADPNADDQAANKRYVDTIAGAAIPSGSIQMYMGVGVTPSGWLEANGQEVLKATYADLYAVIGDAYGTPIEPNSFVLPDMRGVFPRFADNGAGLDPDAASRTDRGDGTTGSAVGTRQGDAVREMEAEFIASGSSSVGSATGNCGFAINNIAQSAATGSSRRANFGFRASDGVPVGGDVRPNNIYVTALIKI